MPKADRSQMQQRRAQSGVNVLVVDDDRDVLVVSADMLRQLGFRVTTAASGHEALAALEELEARPAIVVLDHAMPAMTGLEVAAAMRERGYDGPIILATGYAELSEADQDELTTLQGVLNKPYSIYELETMLARFEVAAANAGFQTVK
jgi:CheY-like chemotaxis protein